MYVCICAYAITLSLSCDVGFLHLLQIQSTLLQPPIKSRVKRFLKEGKRHE